MTQNVYASYKFYDRKGRRLSVFGIPTKDEGGFDFLRLFVFTCSKKDQFCKRIARQMFKDYLEGTPNSHPEVFDIPVIGNKPGQSFINFCKEFYLTKTKRMVKYLEDCLQNKHYIVNLGKKSRVWTKF